MGKRLRFVRPDVDRIDLSDGDWIEVKRRLNVGERRGIISSAAKGGVSSDGQRVHIDANEMAFARVATWLLDWSFVGLDDKPMKLSLSAIRNLDPDTFGEIETALDAHEEAQDAAKNSSASMASGSSTPPNILPDSEANSPSASSLDGLTPI